MGEVEIGALAGRWAPDQILNELDCFEVEAGGGVLAQAVSKRQEVLNAGLVCGAEQFLSQ